MSETEAVKQAVAELDVLRKRVVEGNEVRGELKAVRERLEEITTQPVDKITAAVDALKLFRYWRCSVFLKKGPEQIAKAICELNLWLVAQPGNEPNPGVGRPCHLEPNLMQDARDRQEGLVPTETEIRRDAGDVSRRIRGGLDEVSLRTGAGVAGGDATSWVDID